jgi:pimeloyl-ACP methyl ester carboxylesterase
MRRLLRPFLALMPLGIGISCLALSAALTLPMPARADGFAPVPLEIVYSDRTELGDGLAHYRYDAVVGSGKYDMVRIHRIVREARPNKPVRTRDAVMLLHGNPGSFAGFVAPMVTGVSEFDHSIAIFLAKKDIDVWGMDFGWALVPLEETDFDFMGEWGLAKDVAHAEAALTFARSVRVDTGQGNGKLHVLGFSYGGQAGYTLLGNETVQPRGLRNAKGMIVIDVGVKLEDEADRAFYCAMAQIDQASLESHQYVNDIGSLFNLAAYLASMVPDGPSPIVEGLTNWQALLFIGASTELITGQFWHMVGGNLDEYGIPSSLRFTDDQLFVATVGMTFAPYYPVRIDFDTEQMMCGEVDTPLDDGLAQITVPILHVGAKGGFGPSAYASTTFTASRDVTTITVQRLPDSDEAMDFGHVDTVLARDAETLVWQPILDWIMAHRENRP